MYRGSINPIKNIKTIFYLEIFKKEKPDIVHLITIKPYLYGGLVSSFIKIPCLVTAISGLERYL